MFTRTSEGVYQSSLLAAIPWVRHGFGSRNAGAWPGGYTQVKQVHSDIIYVADGQGGFLGEGDAIVTGSPGQWIGVRTADCVPLLMADVGRRVIAAVHAGWRGTAARIAAKAVRRMAEEFGSDPSDLFVAIGPAIGPCCYAVGPEVAGQLGYQTMFVDLFGANRDQLLGTGVLESHIDTSGLCTACDAGQFHSYRRDKLLAGRMVAAIRIEAGLTPAAG
jgi:YfiH family protein